MAQPKATQQSPNRGQSESAAASGTSSQQSTESCAIDQGPRSAKQEASAAVSDVKVEAREAASAIRSEAASLAHEAQAAASDAARQAKEEGRNFLQRQKERATEEVSHFEAAIRRASDTLREEDDQNLADYADRAAHRLSRIKDYLQRQELGDLLNDVEQTARRRPELVFGGLFVAGLAAARFLKASSRPRGPRRQQNFGPQRGDGANLQYASAYETVPGGRTAFETLPAGAAGGSTRQIPPGGAFPSGAATQSSSLAMTQPATCPPGSSTSVPEVTSGAQRGGQQTRSNRS
jgi:hypothetical protein